MSRSKTIYVFRCGESGLYALTTDPTAHILPSQIYPRIRWRFEQDVTLRLNKNSPKQKIVKAALDAIAKYGFYLIHGATMRAELDGGQASDKSDGCRTDLFQNRNTISPDSAPPSRPF